MLAVSRLFSFAYFSGESLALWFAASIDSAILGRDLPASTYLLRITRKASICSLESVSISRRLSVPNVQNCTNFCTFLRRLARIACGMKRVALLFKSRGHASPSRRNCSPERHRRLAIARRFAVQWLLRPAEACCEKCATRLLRRYVAGLTDDGQAASSFH